MYFNTKEETNIDNELKAKKESKINKKTIIIIGIVLAVIIISLILILLLMNVKRYTLKLNGSESITIYQGSVYIEPGYDAHDNKNNDLSDEVVVLSNLDSNSIGTYTITYTLHNKTRIRNIEVVEQPSVITVIFLNGDKNVYINAGSSYDEPGYSAIDAIDGDLTDKVNVSSNVNTSKRGTYTIIYSVVNSAGVTTSETRTIIVQ